MMKKFLGACAGAALLIGLAGCGNDDPFMAAQNAADAGNWKQAMAIAEKEVKNSPQDVKGLLLLAVAADKCNRRDVALDAALRAVKLNEKDFTAQYTLGRICVADPADRAEGLKHLIRAHELNPGAVEPLVAICNTMSSTNNPQAENYLKKLQNFSGYRTSAAYYNNLAILCMRQRQYDRAKACFKEAYKYGNNDPYVLLNMARFFERSPWPRSAMVYYNLFLRCAGDRPEYGAEVTTVKQHLHRK